MSIIGLDHVQIAAPPGCEAEARRFFGELLGLVEIEKPEPLRQRGGVWFRLGEHQLHIGVERDFAPARKAHPALRVGGDAIDGLAGRLSAAGVPIAWAEGLGDTQRFYSEDPWGNRIEFIASVTVSEDAGWEGEKQGRLEQQFGFILEIDKLKSILRQTPLINGSRRENDAEHSWELAVMAVVLAEHAGAAIDLPRVVRMLLIHDIVEIDAGDTFLYDDEAAKTKVEREERAAERLFGLLPTDQAGELRELWVEFEGLESAEARFARALDRLAPLLHNYHSGGGTWRQWGLDQAEVTQRNEIIGLGSPTLWAYAKEVLKCAVEEGLLPE